MGKGLTNAKTVLVFNTACLGDVLLCNSLVQNIKKIYPESKVIFITDRPFKDVASYQEGVDDVVVFDKKGENRGIFGILKFLYKFRYKSPDISLITYHNERNYMISKLLGAKIICMESNKKTNLPVQEKHNLLLNNLTTEVIHNYPIKYNVPNLSSKETENFLAGIGHYVVFSITSKKDTKDIPIEICTDLLKKFNKFGINVVFTGVGEKSLKYAQHLSNSGCDFVNLVNKTTIVELAGIIKNSDMLLSVDTGTMHLGTAIRVPTLAVWYEENTKDLWMPDKNLYNITVIDKEQTSENIFESALSILKAENVNA